MSKSDLPGDLAPLAGYDTPRRGRNDPHSEDYKAINEAIKAGKITRVAVGSRIWVSRSQAEKVIAMSRKAVAARPTAARARGDDIESRLRRLEEKVDDLRRQLGIE